MAETPDALALAVQFHETYERLAPSFGYETRTETRRFDPTTPNGRLMVAVCGELAAIITRERTDATERERERAAKALHPIWFPTDYNYRQAVASIRKGD